MLENTKYTGLKDFLNSWQSNCSEQTRDWLTIITKYKEQSLIIQVTTHSIVFKGYENLWAELYCETLQKRERMWIFNVYILHHVLTRYDMIKLQAVLFAI